MRRPLFVVACVRDTHKPLSPSHAHIPLSPPPQTKNTKAIAGITAWTSLGALRDEAGAVAGVCATVLETTAKVQAEAAAAWSQWEGDTISIRGPEARPPKFNEVDFAIAFARIECHFFANRGFFDEDGWILKNVDRIRKIPGWIVQGRFDVVTPPESAWALHKAWPEAKFDIIWDAGHASTEPGIIDGLIRATDAAARL